MNGRRHARRRGRAEGADQRAETRAVSTQPPRSARTIGPGPLRRAGARPADFRPPERPFARAPLLGRAGRGLGRGRPGARRPATRDRAARATRACLVSRSARPWGHGSPGAPRAPVATRVPDRVSPASAPSSALSSAPPASGQLVVPHRGLRAVLRRDHDVPLLEQLLEARRGRGDLRRLAARRSSTSSRPLGKRKCSRSARRRPGAGAATLTRRTTRGPCTCQLAEPGVVHGSLPPPDAQEHWVAESRSRAFAEPAITAAAGTRRSRAAPRCPATRPPGRRRTRRAPPGDEALPDGARAPRRHREVEAAARTRRRRRTSTPARSRSRTSVSSR